MRDIRRLSGLTAHVGAILARRDGPRRKSLCQTALTTMSSDGTVRVVTEEIELIKGPHVEGDVEGVLPADVVQSSDETLHLGSVLLLPAPRVGRVVPPLKDSVDLMLEIPLLIFQDSFTGFSGTYSETTAVHDRCGCVGPGDVPWCLVVGGLDEIFGDVVKEVVEGISCVSDFIHAATGMIAGVSDGHAWVVLRGIEIGNAWHIQKVAERSVRGMEGNEADTQSARWDIVVRVNDLLQIDGIQGKPDALNGEADNVKSSGVAKLKKLEVVAAGLASYSNRHELGIMTTAILVDEHGRVELGAEEVLGVRGKGKLDPRAGVGTLGEDVDAHDATGGTDRPQELGGTGAKREAKELDGTTVVVGDLERGWAARFIAADGADVGILVLGTSWDVGRISFLAKIDEAASQALHGLDEGHYVY